MKTAAAKATRYNPLTKFINQKLLFAFIFADLAAFVAGFIHSGPAIVAFPLLAWSPFLLLISLHAAFSARTAFDLLLAAGIFSVAIYLAVIAWRLL